MTRPLTATASTRAACARAPRCSAAGPRGGRGRPTTSTPAASRSAAAARPRSSAVTTNARSAGLTDHRLTSRRTPSGSITPTRSLPGKTSGCSTIAGRDDDVPGADLERACCRGRPARSRTRRARSRQPARGARRPPRARACSSSAARAWPSRSARSAPPTSGPSSTRITRSNRLAAADAPPRALPRRRRSRGRRRGVLDLDPLAAARRRGSSLPRPAAPRRIFS